MTHSDSSTIVHGYVIGTPLGFGYEGTVYMATAPDGSDVVIKEIAVSEDDPEAAVIDRERVWRHRELIGSHCPWVCDTLDVFEDGGKMYVVMERVPGQSLRRVLDEESKIAPEYLKSVAHDVLAGLQHLHDHGIVHRDVKPENIVVRKDASGAGAAKVIDLGVALHTHLPRLTCKSGVFGTHPYIAPEIMSGRVKGVDGRADVYSLGIMLFECLTGEVPYGDKAHPGWLERCLSPERPSLREAVPDLSVALDEALQKMMAIEADDRPESAVQAWEILQSVAWLEAPDAGKPAGPPRTTARSSTSTPPAPVPLAAPVPRLRIESGDLRGACIEIPVDGVSLGRNALNPSDESISRFHFRTEYRKPAAVLRDLGSRNALIVKDRRLLKVVLMPGEEVQVGKTKLTFIT